MTLGQLTDTAADTERGPSAALITVIAIATGVLVANLYYAQPLIALIGPEIGVSPRLAGSVVSVTQIGYGVGLCLFVSLADVIESKMLVLAAMALTVVGLVGVAVSTTAALFFAASFVVGFGSTGAQVLVPLVAHLAPEARRGRIIGNVMAGLLTGIMLARPVALFISGSLGWRSVFWCSAVFMIGIGLVLARMMPRRRPGGSLHFGRVLISMLGLLRKIPTLRWRAAYQALMFSAFNLFWTAAPMMLAARFGLGEHGIGLFALAGAGGALAAPLAGRLADRGLSRVSTAGAMMVLALSFSGTGWAVSAAALAGLVLLAVIIDAAVQANQVISQRIIFSVPPEIRGRVNAIYMTITFIGGAIGSMLGTVTYHWGGWNATAATGALMGVFMLGLFVTELRIAAVTKRGKQARAE